MSILVGIARQKEWAKNVFKWAKNVIFLAKNVADDIALAI